MIFLIGLSFTNPKTKIFLWDLIFLISETTSLKPSSLCPTSAIIRGLFETSSEINFFSASLTAEAACLSLSSELGIEAEKNSNELEKNFLKKIGLIDEIAPRYRTTYFAHIFSGGYSSGYYSYIHAAVLDSDGFEAFKEAGDVFDPDLSLKLRQNIYEKGSTQEAMDLYENFRGRKPIITPLLKVRGLDGSFD